MYDEYLKRYRVVPTCKGFRLIDLKKNKTFVSKKCFDVSDLLKIQGGKNLLRYNKNGYFEKL